MARTSPLQFARQVRQEVSKVVTPSRKETMVTTLMVVIMTVLAALFFFLVDTVFAQIVKLLLPGR
jgi:preprotein translocase subunit SecE